MGHGVQKFSGRDWDWGLKFFFQFTQDRDQKRLENLKFLEIGIGTWSPKIFWSRLGLGFEIFFPIHSRLGSIETRKFKIPRDWDWYLESKNFMVETGIKRGPMTPIWSRPGSRRDPNFHLEIHVHMDLDQPRAHVYFSQIGKAHV